MPTKLIRVDGKAMTCWREGVAHACMVFASAMWSVQNVLSKRALVDVHPVTFALLRDAAALPALVLAARFESNGPLWMPRTRQWAAIAWGGALGIFAVEILYVVGLSLSSPTMTAVWSNAAPLLTCALAYGLGQERFSWLRLGGVVVGAGGLLGTTIWGARALASGGSGAVGARVDVYGDAVTSGSFICGNVALFANIACIAVYFCMLKPMLAWEPRPPPITLVMWLYLGGTLCTALLAAAYVAALALAEPRGGANGATARLDAVRLGLRLDGLRSAGVVEAILFAGLIGGALNYALLTWASSRIGPTLQSLYSVVQIPATALLAWWSLRSVPSLPDIVATAIVVASLALSSVAHAREREGKHEESPAAVAAEVAAKRSYAAAEAAEDGTRGGVGARDEDIREGSWAVERASSRRAEERAELLREGAEVERVARYGSVH